MVPLNHNCCRHQPSSSIVKYNKISALSLSCSACGDEVSEEEIDDYSVSSPNFPDRYPYNADCLWNFTIPENKSVHLSFRDFDLAQKHFVELQAKREVNGDEEIGNGTVKNETTGSLGFVTGGVKLLGVCSGD